MLVNFPAFAQRVTVLGSTLKREAISNGYGKVSCSLIVALVGDLAIFPFRCDMGAVMPITRALLQGVEKGYLEPSLLESAPMRWA